MKTFTITEAQALLPTADALLERATQARQGAAAIEERMLQLRMRIFHSGGLAVDVAAAYRDAAELGRLNETANQALEELSAAGVQLEDMEAGLLNFPFLLDGEVVLLCWRRGEEKIRYWHGLDESYSDKRPLDTDAPKPSNLPRPN